MSNHHETGSSLYQSHWWVRLAAISEQHESHEALNRRRSRRERLSQRLSFMRSWDLGSWRRGGSRRVTLGI
ncbi:MAG TPA: hypothetical protein VJT50_12375 [Pyrinomonadaceae bacterium]|nr:hypothetical protein [Pyrinomonadaceae bacterium]